MNQGIHLKVADVVVPVVTRYEATFGSTVPAEDLPYTYGEVLKEVPVTVNLTELSRTDAERKYHIKFIATVQGQLDTRHYTLTHYLGGKPGWQFTKR